MGFSLQCTSTSLLHVTNAFLDCTTNRMKVQVFAYKYANLIIYIQVQYIGCTYCFFVLCTQYHAVYVETQFFKNNLASYRQLCIVCSDFSFYKVHFFAVLSANFAVYFFSFFIGEKKINTHLLHISTMPRVRHVFRF